MRGLGATRGITRGTGLVREVGNQFPEEVVTVLGAGVCRKRRG